MIFQIILEVLLLLAVLICLIFSFVQLGIKIVSSTIPLSKPPRASIREHPLITVHIATYNEPPVLLIDNLRSLQKQTYQNFETIVLDNNTKDKTVWEPVQSYVKTLPKKFQFFHIEKLQGFKAAALNMMRQKSNLDAKFTATIDADYKTENTFLEEGLSYFTDKNIAFVQFPQAYLNATPTNLGITLEYEHFFSTYMNAANHLNCVGATGTLTIFNNKILNEVGSFDQNSITEDAEIGFRIIESGYKTVYVHTLAGKGFMPYDIEAYKKQKTRWAKGNAVILKKFLSVYLFGISLTFKQKVGLFGQLTAWLNFSLIPTIAILLLIFFDVSRIIHFKIANLTLVLSCITLYSLLIFKFLAFFLRYNKKQPLSVIFRIFLVHIGMNWVYSSALLRSFFTKRLYFERTNKFILPAMPNLIKNTFAEIILTVSALMLLIISMRQGQYINTYPLGIIIIINLLIYYVNWELRYNKTVSAQLISSSKTFNT